MHPSSLCWLYSSHRANGNDAFQHHRQNKISQDHTSQHRYCSQGRLLQLRYIVVPQQRGSLCYLTSDRPQRIQLRSHVTNLQVGAIHLSQVNSSLGQS